MRHTKAVREHWSSVAYIKQALAAEDAFAVAEAWQELDHDTQRALWVSTRDGGIWTTKERQQIRDYEGQLNAKKNHKPPASHRNG